MARLPPLLRGIVLSASLAACSSSSSVPTPSQPGLHIDCSFGGGQGAPSTCLTPEQAAAYYVDQAQKYFDTLDVTADPTSIPTYSDQVARWEWPPWLKLTGFQRQMMLETEPIVLKAFPATVPFRDCRAFSVQPFARCHVSFRYAGGTCPIYEEFTFNDQGETTFIEAWSDRPDLRPMKDVSDAWAEAPDIHRLSTKVPGLGNATGLIDPAGPSMTQIAGEDADVADFAKRAQSFWPSLSAQNAMAGPNVYQVGCGW